MRVSVVLLLFFFCCVQLQRGDDQLVVGDVQLLNKSHVESSEPDQTSVHPDVWTELRELRNMVAELKKQNTALEGRVVSTEVGVEALREENASVFTAPLRGVYYFRFNLVGNSESNMLAVCLFKNKEKILDVSQIPNGLNKYAVGGATLLLQKGDHVYVKLRSNSQISDNSDNHCTFSGFLLFAM
ncbi:complement C1q tumor necrosis factor-related protein 3-like isoform X1 [Colossoma macropomum]|uniref:complement C1q tumor necrosis factor-related protein 3-like isoform X1 n=1 Tax=Colossoma macropomum TaxID=42526 RepID=UPI001863DC7E|nr:complement C1q tumor necrosis factor-related protein 3-like isoform X1 [Colossoma macropomum]